MCMALPARIIELKGNGKALADIAGTIREVNVLIPNVSVGDYVLLYLGNALSRMEKQDAMEILELRKELADFTSRLPTAP